MLREIERGSVVSMEVRRGDWGGVSAFFPIRRRRRMRRIMKTMATKRTMDPTVNYQLDDSEKGEERGLPAIAMALTATVVLLAVTVVAVVVIPLPLLEPEFDPPSTFVPDPFPDPVPAFVPVEPLPTAPGATVGNESAAAVNEVTIVDFPVVMVDMTTTDDLAEEIGCVVAAEDDTDPEGETFGPSVGVAFGPAEPEEVGRDTEEFSGPGEEDFGASESVEAMIGGGGGGEDVESGRARSVADERALLMADVCIESVDRGADIEVAEARLESVDCAAARAVSEVRIELDATTDSIESVAISELEGKKVELAAAAKRGAEDVIAEISELVATVSILEEAISEVRAIAEESGAKVEAAAALPMLAEACEYQHGN